MQCFTVAKYNPKYRDSKGYYTKNEWTSVSDIGSSFQSKKLTKEQYVTTEDKYVHCILNILKNLKCTQLLLTELEDHRDGEEHHVCYAEQLESLVIKDYSYIDVSDIENVIRLNLREDIWCKLESEIVAIYFGYDFYIYVVMNDNISFDKTIYENEDIFLEECKSPFIPNFREVH